MVEIYNLSREVSWSSLYCTSSTIRNYNIVIRICHGVNSIDKGF